MKKYRKQPNYLYEHEETEKASKAKSLAAERTLAHKASNATTEPSTSNLNSSNSPANKKLNNEKP
jgi:hypothetical protein